MNPTNLDSVTATEVNLTATKATVKASHEKVRQARGSHLNEAPTMKHSRVPYDASGPKSDLDWWLAAIKDCDPNPAVSNESQYTEIANTVRKTSMCTKLQHEQAYTGGQRTGEQAYAPALQSCISPGSPLPRPCPPVPAPPPPPLNPFLAAPPKCLKKSP